MVIFKRRVQDKSDVGGSGRDRRRNAREQLGWPSRYGHGNAGGGFVGNLAFDRSPCVVHDLSVAGAGVEVAGGDFAVGDLLVIEVPLLGEHRAARLKLTGEIRHSTTASDGITRVGLEFVDVADLEHALLLRLLRDHRSNMLRTG